MSDAPASGLPRLALAAATNASYLPWCAVALSSCIAATPEYNVDVFLLHDNDVAAAQLSLLREAMRRDGAELTAVAVDPQQLGPLPSGVEPHGGAISCARFLLPDLLPDVPRLLYLDADTLTVSSVRELWDTALDGALMAAVPNVVDTAILSRLTELGIAPGTTYFNSGVLLMDLAALRDRDAGRRVLDVIRDRGEALQWVDQDALNLAFPDAIRPVHPRWNAQNTFWFWREQAERSLGAAAVAEAVSAPAILHFEGHFVAKPWHYLCRHPYATAYRAALMRTPWPDVPLVDRTPATRLIRRLPQSRWMPAYHRLLRSRARIRRWRGRPATGGR